MQSNILDSLGFDPGILMIAMMLIMVFVLVYMVRVSMKLTRFLKRYRIFMRGKDAVSLEKAFAQKFLDVDHLIEVTKNQANEISKMKEILSRTTNKIGIVKYDAFPDVGGKLSFALAMLDESNSGFVLNAIHSREGCYTYVKEIVKGESYIVLGQEEKEALRQAVNYLGILCINIHMYSLFKRGFCPKARPALCLWQPGCFGRKPLFCKLTTWYSKTSVLLW